MPPININYIRNSLNDWMSQPERKPNIISQPQYSKINEPLIHTIYREVKSGESLILDEYYELNPNYCDGLAAPVVIFTENSNFGRITKITEDKLFSRSMDNCYTNSPVVKIRYEAGAVEKEKIDKFSWKVNFQTESSLIVNALINIKPNLIDKSKQEDL
jgi:hypothetical protein